jgi:hypothetical protein
VPTHRSAHRIAPAPGLQAVTVVAFPVAPPVTALPGVVAALDLQVVIASAGSAWVRGAAERGKQYPPAIRVPGSHVPHTDISH